MNERQKYNKHRHEICKIWNFLDDSAFVWDWNLYHKLCHNDVPKHAKVVFVFNMPKQLILALLKQFIVVWVNLWSWLVFTFASVFASCCNYSCNTKFLRQPLFQTQDQTLRLESESNFEVSPGLSLLQVNFIQGWNVFGTTAWEHIFSSFIGY